MYIIPRRLIPLILSLTLFQSYSLAQVIDDRQMAALELEQFALKTVGSKSFQAFDKVVSVTVVQYNFWKINHPNETEYPPLDFDPIYKAAREVRSMYGSELQALELAFAEIYPGEVKQIIRPTVIWHKNSILDKLFSIEPVELFSTVNGIWPDYIHYQPFALRAAEFLTKVKKEIIVEARLKNHSALIDRSQLCAIDLNRPQ